MKTGQGTFFSEKIKNGSRTQKVAYIGVMTALCAVCNMFFEFKLADTQFSLTIFFSAITGMIIGPVYGFAACFLGDLVGYLYNSAGYTYYPWIGICMGLIATLAGLFMNKLRMNFRGAYAFKLTLVMLTTFLICTIAINTTFFWMVYNGMKVPYLVYLNTRLFVKGQIWNSLLNYALMFAASPIIRRFSSKSDTTRAK